MPKLNPISPKILEKILNTLWFHHIRTHWSHKFYFNETTKQTTVIPFHWNEEISVGLLKKILRDIELSVEEFDKLR